LFQSRHQLYNGVIQIMSTTLSFF